MDISKTTSPWYCASAPASCMLSGEHAVLHGHPALVGAIAKRLFVRVRARADKQVIIQSDKLGQYRTELGKLSVQQPFHFILGVLKKFENKFQTGIELEVASEFSHQVGFGSSAAITVATIHALKQLLGELIISEQIVHEARAVVREVQGLGSGADVVASVYGGIVYYEQDPLVIKVLPPLQDLHLVYLGYKTPTPEVVNLVERQRKERPFHFQQLFQKIGLCTKQCYEALLQKNVQRLGELFKQHQLLLSKLGVSTDDIDELVDTVNRLQHIVGSKISGSGLGDCILALGKMPAKYFPRNQKQQADGVQQFAVKMSEAGVIAQNYPEKLVVYG